MNRRLFLRGLGGACVAAPFLGSVMNRGVKAQPNGAPRRLIAMFTHYGCVTSRFFPTKSHGQLEASDLATTTLRPLARFVNKLLLPRGIRAMNEWNGEMSRGQGNDPHQSAASYFTCHPLTPNSDDPFGAPSSALFEPKSTGRSLDHVIAEQLSPGAVPFFVRVGNGMDRGQSAISYSAPEQIFPGFGTPAQIFSYLTGVSPDLAPLDPDSYAAAKGKSIVDLVKDDLDTLERFDMSQSDRYKLELWKALVDDTGGAVTSLQCNAELVTALGATSDNFDVAGTFDSSADVLTRRITDTLDAADLYSNLAVLGAACDANPVIVLKYPAALIYRGLGLTQEAHGLSQRTGNGTMTGSCVPGVLDMLRAIDEYHATKFAHLVEQLEAIPEGDGKLLDGTAAVWFQEMSDGAAHNLNNLPIVQVGSCGGYFKTGWAVNVEDGRENLTAGNSEVVCAEGGEDMINGILQNTGTDPDLANAPINKYFCNLMNALGVKAGDDGFPALGGTREVTKFGMYDKTEDFIGGGTKTPEIHDPGEFAQLRA